LTFGQLENSIGALLGAEAASAVKAALPDLPSPEERTFPPLSSPREGNVIAGSVWETSYRIAEAAGQYVLDHFAAVTGCPATAPTDDCALLYLTALAEKAYRRPLDQGDRDDLVATFAEMRTAGNSVMEALPHAVTAILSDAQFLYRTELGDPAVSSPAPNGTVAISPHERASALSFFLLDGPPDPSLLAAASDGRLARKEEIVLEADRLLITPAARNNLQAAMYAYFGLPGLDAVIVDPTVIPPFSPVSLRESMKAEAREFLRVTLWQGRLADLLTSRRSAVNHDLALLYGVPLPNPPGPAPGDGLIPVELPAHRAGMLTQAGFLTTRARPNGTALIERGVMVNALMACSEIPPGHPYFETPVPNLTRSEAARSRARTPACAACHDRFDPYGLVLESYDVIGRYRIVDDQQRPVDTSVTLSSEVGGGEVKDAVALAHRLAGDGTFARCLATHLMEYALADGTTQVKRNDCALNAVMESFQASDQSFWALLRELATSPTVNLRRVDP
jgi:hypothetical protein